MFQTGDTIAAISSATGAAARMIVRISGPNAQAICKAIASRKSASAQLRLTSAGISFPATIYDFHSPRSVTGEDIVEFHMPGNPVLARMLLDELIRQGARHAEPGEFTARAYFNGQINLTEAEGVAATIGATTDRELAAARQLLGGELARRLRPILDAIAEMLGLVEVGIDFAEEDVSFISRAELTKRIGEVETSLRSLLIESNRFERIAHEPSIVLVGRPNAGKSTLLNALAGAERAVVSPVVGTTRDAIWSHVRLKRGIVRIVDVAGIEPTSDSHIDHKMQAAAAREIEAADVVLLIQDLTDSAPPPVTARTANLVVLSKSDLAPPRPVTSNTGEVRISAIGGEGMEILRNRLDQICFGSPRADGLLALNARHVEAIEGSLTAMQRSRDLIDDGSELVALELREALDSVGSILGSVSPDDVLGRIFSKFCIGK